MEIYQGKCPIRTTIYFPLKPLYFIENIDDCDKSSEHTYHIRFYPWENRYYVHSTTIYEFLQYIRSKGIYQYIPDCIRRANI